MPRVYNHYSIARALIGEDLMMDIFGKNPNVRGFAAKGIINNWTDKFVHSTLGTDSKLYRALEFSNKVGTPFFGFRQGVIGLHKPGSKTTILHEYFHGWQAAFNKDMLHPQADTNKFWDSIVGAPGDNHIWRHIKKNYSPNQWSREYAANMYADKTLAYGMRAPVLEKLSRLAGGNANLSQAFITKGGRIESSFLGVKRAIAGSFFSGTFMGAREAKEAMDAAVALTRNVVNIGKKGIAALILSASLMFGGTAHARDLGVETGKTLKIYKSDSVLTKSSKMVNLIDTTLALTDKNLVNKDNLFAIMYRTGVHESGGMQYLSQDKGGPARSYFQVEPATAKDLVQDWAAKKKNAAVFSVLETTSGKTREELLSMSKSEFSELLSSNQLFSASVARYRMGKDTLPTSLDAQAKFWQEHYQRGGSKVAAKRIKSFVSTNENFSARVSSALLKQQKTLSKGGTATSKMVKWINKILPG